MLSVVMPAHNEEAFLDAAVREVVEALRSRSASAEVVIVENGSTDETTAMAAKLEAELPEVRALSNPEPDYGAALRTGFLAATHEYVAVFDVDYYDFDFLDRALVLLNEPGGPDIVVGAKRGVGSHDTRIWSRRLVTAVFSNLLRYGFGLKVSDTHGIKVVRRAPLLDLADKCRTGSEIFDTELILRAERAGLNVAAIPVTVEETRPSRTSIAKRIPKTLLALGKLRIALWRGR